MSASHDCSVNLSLHPKQTQAITTDATEVLFGGAAGPGKALALDTPIPTPTGWTTQGALRVGDKVFDENGNPCLVTATTEVMIGRPCYRVTFDDGTYIVADEAHEWLTFTNSDKEAIRKRCPEYREARQEKRHKRGTGKKPWLSEANSLRDYVYLPLPTGAIRTTLEIKETLTIRGRSNHFIKVCYGLQTEEHNLPIDPYVLGAWLGDGTSCDGSITTADSEIIDRIKIAGFDVYRWQSGKYRWNIKGLRSKLVKAGLRNNKHIPNAYLRASFEQRMELLRGLMDTDGTISKDGECDFTNCNHALASGVLELLVSVGIKATLKTGRAKLNGVDCGEKYRIAFSTSKTVFGLSRKKDRLRKNERGVQSWRAVKSVETIESVPVKCITVNSESHLYLAGSGMIPTHNSHAMRVASIIWASEIPGLQVYLFRRLYDDLVKNHLEGPNGYHNLLAPWVQNKFVRIVDDEIRFWNGSKIYLCHVQHEKNRFKYQGAEIHVLLIDELTHFTEVIYRFLRGRVRMIGLDHIIPEKYKGMFPRILAGSNPGNIGHMWVKSSFIDGGEDGRIREMSEEEGGMRRQFIKARLDDNPSLLKDDPKYVSKLSGLGNPALVKAMKEGDWNIIEGAFFTEWSEERHVLRPVAIPDHWLRFRSGDWGSAKPYSFHWWAVASEDWQHPDGNIVPRGAMIAYKELYGVKTSQDGTFQPDVGVKEPSDVVAKHILERDEGENISYGVLDPAAFATVSGPSIAETMAKEGVLFRPADNKRVANGGAIGGHDQFRKRLLGDGDGRPMLFFFENCLHAIRTIPVLQHDPNRPEDINTHMEDHAYDDCRYAVMSRPWTTDSLPSEEDREKVIRQKALQERMRAAKKERNERDRTRAA